MMKRNAAILAMLIIAFFMATNIQADVKKESTTQLDFKGTLGAIMKFFGAGKPSITAEYYKGDIYKSDAIDEKGKLTRSEIIDLDRELFISIDHKKKQYSQMTFDEWRQMIEQNIQKMESTKEDQAKEDEPEVEWDFRIDISKPGETEMIAGKKAEKVIITLEITAKATDKDTKTEQGDMIVTSTNWMVDEPEGQKEIDNFHKKLFKRLGVLPGKGGLEEMMSKINQSNPKLAEAINKMQGESKKLSGVPLRTQTVYETKSAATTPGDQEEMKKETEIPTSIGGLMKGFGKKIAKPDKEKSDQNILMESKTEVTTFGVTSIDSKEFEIPGNYKLQKK